MMVVCVCVLRVDESNKKVLLLPAAAKQESLLVVPAVLGVGRKHFCDPGLFCAEQLLKSVFFLPGSFFL